MHKDISNLRAIVNYLLNGSTLNDEDGVETIESLDTLLMYTGMTEAEITLFKRQVMLYCKDNLARVEAYIPFPFVKRYILQEV